MNTNILELSECIVVKSEDFTTWKAFITSEKIKNLIECNGIIKFRFDTDSDSNCAGHKPEFYENWLQTTKASANVKKGVLEKVENGLFIDYLISKHNKTKVSKFYENGKNKKFNAINTLNLQEIKRELFKFFFSSSKNLMFVF
jgi:hypothetical protein